MQTPFGEWLKLKERAEAAEIQVMNLSSVVAHERQMREAAEAALAELKERVERAEADREGYLLALQELQARGDGESTA